MQSGAVKKITNVFGVKVGDEVGACLTTTIENEKDAQRVDKQQVASLESVRQ